MNITRNLDEATRRVRQETIGLFITPDVPPVTNNQQDDIMQENTVTPSKPSRASRVIDHLTTPPTFREVAIYEAKKAAVWAPLLASTLLGVLWVNKRFILKAATQL